MKNERAKPAKARKPTGNSRSNHELQVVQLKESNRNGTQTRKTENCGTSRPGKNTEGARVIRTENNLTGKREPQGTKKEGAEKTALLFPWATTTRARWTGLTVHEK